MITKIDAITLHAFNIAGIAVRTTNKNGQAQKDIGELWLKFTHQNLLQQIPGKVSDDIYCVYTDYETDHTGFYTAILGCKVNLLINNNGRFTGIAIPAEKYEVYSLSGKFPGNVGEAWMEIWAKASGRKYTADFDLYTANAKSFEETEVKIFLAVL